MFKPTQILFDSVNHKATYPGHELTMPENSTFVDIACGAVYHSDIIFLHEGIRVRVSAYGDLEFYDKDDALLGKTCDPADSDGRGRYTGIGCTLKDGQIILNFPLYEWIDNYPHCDGESDRWDCRCIGRKPDVVFDLATRRLVKHPA